ncbi:MAG: hypothetical protein JWM37_465 [Candidatus Saccharibacteria bacterium]|nr:hypothetical protein [Candidatus Saccharibacteria bacterium]
MINLLPPDIKQGFRYARYNYRLLHWCVALLCVFIGLTALTTAGLILLGRSAASYRTEISQTEASLASQNLKATEKQITDMSNNLKLMNTVLSKEILFSQLLTRLGSLMPSDAVLTNLSISQTTSAIDITANTANYDAATQLQVNLADPANQIFSKADIVSISCASGTDVTNAAYPCTVGIKALFKSDNPFLFINNKATTK